MLQTSSSVEEVGEHNLPGMLAYGMLAVYREIERAFPPA